MMLVSTTTSLSGYNCVLSFQGHGRIQYNGGAYTTYNPDDYVVAGDQMCCGVDDDMMPFHESNRTTVGGQSLYISSMTVVSYCLTMFGKFCIHERKLVPPLRSQLYWR